MNGKRFAGFLDAFDEESAFMSEWTLDLEMHDLRRLIHEVPKEQRQATVFLGGHSRGVIFTRAFAAYQFEDGMLGADELAGLVFIDGEGRYRPWMTDHSYTRQIQLMREGVAPRFVTFPPFGPYIYTFMEILVMASAEGFGDPNDPELGPDGIFRNKGPLTLFLPSLFRGLDVTLTNEAFAGFVLDQESGPVSIVRANMGKLAGPTAVDAGGVYPTDENHLYHWLNYDEVDPEESADVQDLLHSVYFGPSNAVDPYYSARIGLDMAAADQLETVGTWREK
ncbi:MAG: hypothetical protein M5R36_03225 [Deltaproteobacteria bacterium]|nr:hypothetical protein [Deltaproteobacteria bacterium]